MPKGSSTDPVSAAPSGSESYAQRARARLGTTLRGKWRLDELLGVGGMAAVYAATHRNGVKAAVKVLHTELSVDDTLRRRFFREGHIANRVGHPGVVRVLDDDVADDGSLFLVTELLEGESLEDRRLRSGGTLPENEVVRIVDQLLDVLKAAHAKEVIHRDLKPENMFLTTEGHLKVLDFGIARAIGVTKGTHATRAGMMLGTPAFMAPEQARGLWDEVDRRTDLWAVGATMFRLLSGALVHTGRTPNEELLAAMTNPAPRLASRAAVVSAAVAGIVDKALAYEKGARFNDAEEMQRAIRAVHSERTSRPPTARVIVPDSVVRHGVAPLRDLYAEEAVEDTEVASSSLTNPDPRQSLPPPPPPRPPDEAISRTLAASPAEPKSRRTPLWIAAAGSLVLISVGLAVGAGRSSPGPRAPKAAATSAPPTPSTETPPPARSTEAPAPPAASAEAPPAAAVPSVPSVGASTPSKAASAPGAAVSSGNSGVNFAGERPAQGAAVAPPARSQPARPSASANPTCTPPYVVDPTTGRHDWKLECLH